MATLPSSPRTAETPIGTVIAISISLAVVVFLIFVSYHNKWTKRIQPRACLVYEESESSISDDEWHGSRARRVYQGGRGEYTDRRGHREEGRRREQSLGWWWWRRGRHPHAYCKECDARREAERERKGGRRTVMRDLESGEENVRRPRPTYTPHPVREYGRRWEQDCDDAGGYTGNWQADQYSAAEEEQWRQPHWNRTQSAGYGGNRGRVRVPVGVGRTKGRAYQGQSSARGDANQNWKALQWQCGRKGAGGVQCG